MKASSARITAVISQEIMRPVCQTHYIYSEMKSLMTWCDFGGCSHEELCGSIKEHLDRL